MEDFDKNKGLVYKVFNDKFQYARYAEDDLIQEGLMALWNACNTYDKSKGVAFSTFATTCIDHAMGMYMRKENALSARCVSIEDTIDPEKGPATYRETLESDDDESNRQDIEVQRILDIISKEPQYSIVLMKMRGMSQAEIARRLGVTQCSISEQLRGLYERVRIELGIESPKKNKK